MKTGKREIAFYVVAFLAGALVWIVVSAISGRKEAWDSSLHFPAGYPAICLMALAMGFLVPKSSWRWGVTPFAGQFVALLVTQGAGNLLPLGIIAFAVISLPAVIAARVGAYFGRRRMREGEA